MKTFEIMFNDLTPKAQKEFLKFQGVDSISDGNWEVIPIAAVELEDEEEEVTDARLEHDQSPEVQQNRADLAETSGDNEDGEQEPGPDDPHGFKSCWER